MTDPIKPITMYCTCLSISRDPLCVYHGDVDKVKALYTCEHEYEEVSRPMFHNSGLHTDKCFKCGYVYTYDTSD